MGRIAVQKNFNSIFHAYFKYQGISIWSYDHSSKGICSLIIMTAVAWVYTKCNPWSICESVAIRAGEVTWEFIALTILAGNLASVPSTHCNVAHNCLWVQLQESKGPYMHIFPRYPYTYPLHAHIHILTYTKTQTTCTCVWVSSSHNQPLPPTALLWASLTVKRPWNT